jgi:hypothetical protein
MFGNRDIRAGALMAGSAARSNVRGFVPEGRREQTVRFWPRDQIKLAFG